MPPIAEPWNTMTLLAGNSQAMFQLGLTPLLFLLAVSVASAFIVAFLYQHFHAASATGTQVYRSFPLLGLSLTAIFIAVQFSLPLSVGLLGALSLVRFRTPIKEPEEIGCIMLIVATAVACATFKLQFLGIVFVVAIVVFAAQRRGAGLFARDARDGVMEISVDASRYGAETASMRELLTSYLRGGRIESVASRDERIVVACRFGGMSDREIEAAGAAIRAHAVRPAVEIFVRRTGTV